MAANRITPICGSTYLITDRMHHGGGTAAARKAAKHVGRGTVSLHLGAGPYGLVMGAMTRWVNPTDYGTGGRPELRSRQRATAMVIVISVTETCEATQRSEGVANERIQARGERCAPVRPVTETGLTALDSRPGRLRNKSVRRPLRYEAPISCRQGSQGLPIRDR